MKIGVLAVQGDFEAHAKVLAKLNTSFTYVTHPKHLSGIKGLILPGGESTAMLKFLVEDNFLEAIKKFASAGRYLFGTCAGAILLAREVINPAQISLNLVDVSVERNAYGRQLSSHIGQGVCFEKEMEMVFIRAPRIVDIGPGVRVFATYEKEPVGVIENQFMMTTFHPELTNDVRVHQLFIDQCI